MYASSIQIFFFFISFYEFGVKDVLPDADTSFLLPFMVSHSKCLTHSNYCLSYLVFYYYFCSHFVYVLLNIITSSICSFTLDTRFLNFYRKDLIERVVAVGAIADHLFPHIGNHKYCLIQQASNNQEKMRQVFDIVMKGGKVLRGMFCKILQQEEGNLLEDLQSSAQN